MKTNLKAYLPRASADAPHCCKLPMKIWFENKIRKIFWGQNYLPKKMYWRSKSVNSNQGLQFLAVQLFLRPKNQMNTICAQGTRTLAGCRLRSVSTYKIYDITFSENKFTLSIGRKFCACDEASYIGHNYEMHTNMSGKVAISMCQTIKHVSVTHYTKQTREVVAPITAFCWS